ncbi:SxtJ family membrane protein [Myxococcota bacterium]|nr:SxtJ family membrane protein [Myxococcota bacterium]
MAKRDESREAKKLGIFLGVVGAALAGWFFYRGRELAPYIFGGIAAVSLFFTLVLPGLWLKFFRGWMKAAEGISYVMTRVILSLVYFLMFTPIGLIMRITGNRTLDLKFRDGRPTYWIDKPKGEFTLERYRKPY